ncbi:hypothetical protein M885DRAFT_530571 [Pelagophyceae sp. CCMP2097]|nr:hypothetical protein M885DRAFT_530571 [Pelagophyceae sp. CCMP2097]
MRREPGVGARVPRGRGAPVVRPAAAADCTLDRSKDSEPERSSFEAAIFKCDAATPLPRAEPRRAAPLEWQGCSFSSNENPVAAPRAGDDASPRSPRAFPPRAAPLTPSKEEIVASQTAAKRVEHTFEGSWTISPETGPVQRWDAALCFAVLFTAVVTPFEVAFLQGPTRLGALFAVNQVINVIFIVDVVLQFFLHYQLPKKQAFSWVRHHRRIVRHYLQTWFCLDFISVLPMEVLSMGLPVFGALKGVRLIRLLRLAKLLRIFRSSRLINRYRADMSISYGVISMIKFVMLTIFTSHFLACLWGLVGNMGSPDNSWLERFRGPSKMNAWDIDESKHQYILSLYFAIMTLTTVGYGDVTPVNISEYAVMIVCMFCGGFMWAYVIGQVCATAATLDIKAIEHQQLYDQVNNMLVDMVVSRKLSASVRSFLFQTEDMERRMAYSSLITLLSPELQGDLCEEMSSQRLNSVQYFTCRSNPFRLAIFKKMTRRLYCPEEVIHCASLMVIANQGCVGCGGWLYTRGKALNCDFLLKQQRDEVYMRCLNYVEVECLTREDLADVLVAHPADRAPLAWWTVFLALVHKARLAGLFDIKAAQYDARYPVVRRALRAQLLRGHAAPGLRRQGSLSRHAAIAPAVDAPALTDPAAELLAVVTILRREGAALRYCSADVRDSFAVVEAAISGDAAAFEFASLRLRADPRLVRLALDRSGGGWRTSVLPYVNDDFRALLGRAELSHGAPRPPPARPPPAPHATHL